MRTLLALLLLTTSAMAQLAPQQQPPSSLQQALGQKLLEEINANVQLRSQLIDKDAEIKVLKEKEAKEK